MEDRTYQMLQRRIRELLGIDLDGYKTPQMRRRLETFVRKRAGNEEPLQFIRTLDRRPEVLADLRDTLTINVSEFFRDSAQWELLRRELFPELLAQQRRVQIWSAGCSAGQEPYSLAIVADELGAADRVHIAATDYDRSILQRARAGGPYVDGDLKNLSRAQRADYFSKDGGTFTVVDSIRRVPRFSEMNLLADRFRVGFHLIACRHVMIYLAPETKLTLLEKFREALAPGGYLFIGGTEALLGDEREGFEPASGNFYRKVAAAGLRAAA